MFKVVVEGFKDDLRIFDYADTKREVNKKLAIEYANKMRKSLDWNGLNNLKITIYDLGNNIILEL